VDNTNFKANTQGLNVDVIFQLINNTASNSIAKMKLLFERECVMWSVD